MRRTAVLLTALVCGLVVSAHPAIAQSSGDPFVKALYRYAPVMRFDNGEDDKPGDGEWFFPMRVTPITNNTGNRLTRENGALLARRNADGSGLNLSYLRGVPPLDTGVYPNGDAILEEDRIDERSNDLDTYRADAQRWQSDRRYRNRIFGHVVRHYERGFLAGAWLQYWFFYYYDDVPGTDAGDHEGDWEMVQVFVDRDAKPQVAVYNHHEGQSYCPWAKIRKDHSRPVVFVARGSHASYFRSGNHGTDTHNDGDLRRTMRVIRIGNSSPRWLKWPGYWGASEGVPERVPIIGGSLRSPRGPRFHAEFLNPQQLYRDAGLDDDCKQ